MDKQQLDFYNNSDVYFRTLKDEHEEYYKEFLEFVNYYAKVGDKIVDIGCGTGQSSFYLSKLGYNVIGVDEAQRFCDYAQENYPDVQFIQADVAKLPFKDNYFDIVSSYNTVEHFADVEKALVEMIRVIKPNGQILLHSPNLLSLKHVIDAFNNNGLTFEGKKNKLKLFLLFWRNSFMILKKKLQHRIVINYRQPDFNYQFPDNDATCYLNPVDLKKILKKYHCKIISYQQIKHLKASNIFKRIMSNIMPSYMSIIRIVAQKK